MCVYTVLPPPPNSDPTHTPPSSAHQKKAPCPLRHSRTWTAYNKAGLWLAPHIQMTKFPWLSSSGRGVMCLLELGTQAWESIMQAPTHRKFWIVGGEIYTPWRWEQDHQGVGGMVKWRLLHHISVWWVSRQLMVVEGTFLLASTCEGFCLWEADPRIRYLPMWLCIGNVGATSNPTTQELFVGGVLRARHWTKPFTHYLIWFSKQLYEWILLLVPF